jgi:hypothetical protein
MTILGPPLRSMNERTAIKQTETRTTQNSAGISRILNGFIAACYNEEILKSKRVQAPLHLHCHG